MTTTPHDVARILRLQAWERAKGELQAMLQSYVYVGHGADDFDASVDALPDPAPEQSSNAGATP